MHFLRKVRIQVVFVVVMILFASGWGSNIGEAQATEIKPTITAEWKDPSSGSIYYNWNSSDGDKYTSGVIVSTTDGNWIRLADKFSYIYENWRNIKYPYLYTKHGADPDEDLLGFGPPLYLDVEQNIAVRGNLYDISPDGSWGLYSANDTGAQKSSDGKYVTGLALHSYFLKNMTTGEIQEWISSSESITMHWLPDSKLLVAQYSPVAKQKTISTFDPVTGKTKLLVLGKLYQYSEQEQKIVFVKNEPKRLPWVYDLNTGKSRLLMKAEEEKLYAWTDPRPTTIAPDNLDITSLPIIDLPIRRLYEHEVSTEKDSVLVPFTFVKDGKTFIPLRYLVTTFNLSVSQRAGDMYDYQYQLTGPTGQIVTLDRNNSRVFQFRLYVTPEVLNQVGLRDVTVTTDMMAVIK